MEAYLYLYIYILQGYLMNSKKKTAATDGLAIYLSDSFLFSSNCEHR